MLQGDTSKKKLEKVELSAEIKTAVDRLKTALITPLVLHLADLSKPFLLETDASGHGLAAILSRKARDGKYHPVAYDSQTLSKIEKHYHSSKLDFLALKWAVTEHFKEYLLVGEFIVRTDNNPLTYIMSMLNLDAIGHWCLAALTPFNFTLEYQWGKDNCVADAWSRMPGKIDEQVVWTIMDGVMGSTSGSTEVFDLDTSKVMGACEASVRVVMGCTSADNVLEQTDWTQAQKEDEYIEKVHEWLAMVKKSNLHIHLGELAGMAKVKSMLVKETDSFFERTVYLQVTLKRNEKGVWLFVVPHTHQTSALNDCHQEAGHQGQERT